MSGVSRVFTTHRRQLTSVLLRQALKAFVVPPVVNSYNIVAIRAIWHRNDDDRQLTHMQICPKRTQLELILQEDPNIVLYISAITGLEKQKPKGKKTVAMSNDTEDLLNELSQDSAVSEEQSAEPPLGTLKAYPGVAFWIAFDTPLCTASDFENKLEKAFFQAGLNICECKIVKPRSTETKM